MSTALGQLCYFFHHHVRCFLIYIRCWSLCWLLEICLHSTKQCVVSYTLWGSNITFVCAPVHNWESAAPVSRESRSLWSGKLLITILSFVMNHTLWVISHVHYDAGRALPHIYSSSVSSCTLGGKGSALPHVHYEAHCLIYTRCLIYTTRHRLSISSHK